MYSKKKTSTITEDENFFFYFLKVINTFDNQKFIKPMCILNMFRDLKYSSCYTN